MHPIHVPRPPKEAYNKNRPISDLIKAQLKHFQHIEQKLLPEQRPNIPHHELTTESAAAKYIAAMTQALCSGDSPKLAVMPRRHKGRHTAKGIPLAASADEEQGFPVPPDNGAKKPERTGKSKRRSKSR